MIKTHGVTKDEFGTLKIHRDKKNKFTKAVMDYYGTPWGHLMEEAETAIDKRTEELHAMIEARDKRG